MAAAVPDGVLGSLWDPAAFLNLVYTDVALLALVGVPFADDSWALEAYLVVVLSSGMVCTLPNQCLVVGWDLAAAEGLMAECFTVRALQRRLIASEIDPTERTRGSVIEVVLVGVVVTVFFAPPWSRHSSVYPTAFFLLVAYSVTVFTLEEARF